jgi:hypothetical protein
VLGTTPKEIGWPSCLRWRWGWLRGLVGRSKHVMGGFLKSRVNVRRYPRRINAKGKTDRGLICVQFILRSFFLGLFFRLLRVSRPQRVKIAQESSETPPGLEIENQQRGGGEVWKEPRTGFLGCWDGFASRVCWEYGEAWWTRARRRLARLSAVIVAPNDRRECLVVDAGRGLVWPMSVGNKGATCSVTNLSQAGHTQFSPSHRRKWFLHRTGQSTPTPMPLASFPTCGPPTTPSGAGRSPPLPPHCNSGVKRFEIVRNSDRKTDRRAVCCQTSPRP